MLLNEKSPLKLWIQNMILAAGIYYQNHILRSKILFLLGLGLVGSGSRIFQDRECMATGSHSRSISPLGVLGWPVVDLRGEPEPSIGFPYLGSDYLSDVELNSGILLPHVIHLMTSGICISSPVFQGIH